METAVAMAARLGIVPSTPNIIVKTMKDTRRICKMWQVLCSQDVSRPERFVDHVL